MISNTGAENPIEELTHDHGHLSDLVQAVGSVLAKVARGECTFVEAVDELEDGVESLREALLLHFAREEEGFFPFVEKHVPELAPQVASLLADHDAVVNATAELTRRLRRGLESHDLCQSAYATFIETYGAHAQAEGALLREVEAKLDPALHGELRAILKAI